MAASHLRSISLPKYPHCAVLVGATGCGKTRLTLGLLANYYKGVFSHIVILCPTLRHNQTYQNCRWLFSDPEVYLIDPADRLHDSLRAFYKLFQGESTLFIVDDMAASKSIKIKRDMLSELVFSGRHAKQSVWVLTQKFNALSTDVRSQTQWVGLFHTKDRDSFKECLDENHIVPLEDRERVRKQLAERKHAVLLLKTSLPADYQVI